MTPQEEQFETWVDSLPGGFWDDCTDASKILSTVEAAFKAGWEARSEHVFTSFMPEASGPRLEPF